MEDWHKLIQERAAKVLEQSRLPAVHVSPEAAKAGSDPMWSRPDKVHDWRNHVPNGVQALWGSFTAEQQGALVDWAEELAGREEWE